MILTNRFQDSPEVRTRIQITTQLLGPSGPRRKCGVNWKRSRELRRGGFAGPEQFHQTGAASLWVVKPKKKDTTKRVLLFGIDKQFREHPPDPHLKPNRSPVLGGNLERERGNMSSGPVAQMAQKPVSFLLHQDSAVTPVVKTDSSPAQPLGRAIVPITERICFQRLV